MAKKENQKLTNYQPTAVEERLLEVLMNPEFRSKTVTDICKAAKCSRVSYYDAFAKPGFTAMYNRLSLDLVKQSVAPVLNTFIREAQRGSYQHGKAILEMAGIFPDKLRTKDQLDIDEQKARIKKLQIEIKNQAGESVSKEGIQEFLKATRPTEEDIAMLYEGDGDEEEE